MLHSAKTVELAAFVIARGYYQPFDLFSAFQGDKRYFGALSINWAAVADADHGTENIRWMGGVSLNNIVYLSYSYEIALVR